MGDHAAVIREQIDTGHYGYCQMVGRGACTCGQADRLAAVAALDALLAERDAARSTAEAEAQLANEEHARAEAAEATLTHYRDALNHYANEDHWALDPATYDTTNTAGYAMWGYDGGHEEPWRIARAALDGPNKTGPAEEVGMPDVSGDAEGPVPVRTGRVGGASTSLDGPKEERQECCGAVLGHHAYNCPNRV